jgi:Stigma-specific protein, Stig1
MAHEWDEFSKLLAEPVPRRESLWRLGLLFAGAVLAPLGLGTAAWAGGTDRCRSFCDRCPRSRRTSCLTACRACNDDPSHLCGDCSRGYFCADFLFDVRNCGACSNDCWSSAGANEEAACIDGECMYRCVAGAVECNGACTFLNSDPRNCGACGNICPAAAPVCNWGTCDCDLPWMNCDGVCTDLNSNPRNCGGCGNVCPPGEVCAFGVCCNPTVNDCWGGVP